jgi:ketopantoate reductase
MNQPTIVVGIGELGSVFARGLLRSGHPVYPITRGMNVVEEAKTIPDPALVLLAVAENDLHATLDQIPEPWRDKLCLLQNELLPRDWLAHAIHDPTVIAVWFEKKQGQDVRVLLPSPVYGPQSATIKSALAAVDIPARTLSSSEELLFELVRKNVYILTINIAGLVTGGTVTELWRDYQTLAREIADEIISIQAWLTDEELPRDRLIEGMLEAFAGDPDHKCLGRTALPRLRRALGHADETGLAIPKLREIYARFGEK